MGGALRRYVYVARTLSKGRVKIFVKNPKLRVSEYLSSAGSGAKMMEGWRVRWTAATFLATARLKLGG